MPAFVHQRHKHPGRLPSTCDLVLACPPLHSGVNASRIMRLAGCCGVRRVVACAPFRIDRKIARDAVEHVPVERHRSLLPVLKRLKRAGYPLFGLEQASDSACLYTFQYPPKCVLVVGHERHGLDPETLRILDSVVEIPTYGLPYSYNVVTAVAMALYEYGRQHGAASIARDGLTGRDAPE